jgi:hypothetical protein
MKVLEIYVPKEDGSIEVKTEFSAKELQLLIQLGVNVSSSMGLGSYQKFLKMGDEEKEESSWTDDYDYPADAGLND